MDNTISKLLEYFKHITRDMFIYVLSGSIIVGNILLVDTLGNENLLLTELNSFEYLLLIIIIIAYIIGHIISSLMYGLRKIFEALRFPITKRIDIKDELKIFIKNREIYEYFIERQNQLYYIRRNLSGAFFISSIIDFCFYNFISSNKIIFIFGIVIFICSILMFFFYHRALENYNSKVKNINELLKEN